MIASHTRQLQALASFMWSYVGSVRAYYSHSG